jgi:hypothetical protein
MIKKSDVDRVIIQAEYQSGDRYTIASALKVDPRLGVLILHRQSSPGSAQDLKRLYGAVENAAKRVALVPVPAKEDTPRNLKKYKGKDLALVAVEQQYANATQAKFIDSIVPKSDPAREKQKFEFDRLNLVEDGIKFERVSGGTYRIGEVFASSPEKKAPELQQFWSLDRELPVRLWLYRKGFVPSRRYVFLFAKQGGRSAEKAHHFTSLLTWRLLTDEIRKTTDIVPVAVGDNIGLKTEPSLVEFWEEQGWKDAFDGKPTRRDQLGLWAYFAKVFGGCSILGMRSGMIEVPALMGIRTRYIEERGNAQSERMASWIGNVPTWSRQIVERTPGISQQKYMANYKYTRNPSDQERRTANLLVTGFSKSGLKEKQPGALSEEEVRNRINAVFGSEELAASTRIDPRQFMIQPNEFNEIIQWINQTPRPSGHGTVTTPEVLQSDTLGRADREIASDILSRVAARNWSTF